MSVICGMTTLLLLFILFCPARPRWNPNMQHNKEVMVQLFEWKWRDVAAECEEFLAPKGYGGVQVSPPTDHVVVMGDTPRPWWERYQPVSYKIASRSGDEAAFREMVARCNNVGVRIYVDAVFNHMTEWWPSGTGSTAGSFFDSGLKFYPAVPYTAFDFNDIKCSTPSGNIENCFSAEQVRNCRLNGLNDLNQASELVRDKIINYLNALIDWGVAGFRIDAAKHMWPSDLDIIFGRLNNLNTSLFPAGTRPFIYQEVVDLGGETVRSEEYVGNGRVTEFKYGKFLGEALRGSHQLKQLASFGEGWGMCNRHEVIVFVDNHDTQRGHSGMGATTITFKDPRLYTMANAFMLAWPYGVPRVMSSYSWDEEWIGPPHDTDYNIISPTMRDDNSCTGGWMCEHRWKQIYNMVEFHNIAEGTYFNNWWDNGNNQIAFCRGDKAFIAINNDDTDLKAFIKTSLSPGIYCDIISGAKVMGQCTGKALQVLLLGNAYVEILASDPEGVFAVHADSKL